MRKRVGKCQLLRLLDEKRTTQVWLSDRTGIALQQISDYANNRRTMNLRNAAIIAEALGCSIDDLYVWVVQGGDE